MAFDMKDTYLNVDTLTRRTKSFFISGWDANHFKFSRSASQQHRKYSPQSFAVVLAQMQRLGHSVFPCLDAWLLVAQLKQEALSVICCL